MITRVSFFVCLLYVALINAKSNRIVGGEDAHPGQFKYQISLQNNNKHVCGGTIIADQYILTAGHCVVGDENQFRLYNFQVVAGSTNLLLNDGVRIDVEKIYVPKEYSSYDYYSDIAVLKLHRGLGLGCDPNLDKIGLPSRTESSHVDDTAVVAGYGYKSVEARFNYETNRPELFNIHWDYKLRYCTVKIISNEECAKKKEYIKITENHMCGHAIQHNEQPKGLCKGDSGGAVVYDNRVIAVVSRGQPNCQEHRYPAIYTRVSPFTEFIAEVMKGAESSDMLIHKVHRGESSSGS